MAERSIAAVLKTAEAATLPGVRIPLPPPILISIRPLMSSGSDATHMHLTATVTATPGSHEWTPGPPISDGGHGSSARRAAARLFRCAMGPRRCPGGAHPPPAVSETNVNHSAHWLPTFNLAAAGHTSGGTIARVRVAVSALA